MAATIATQYEGFVEVAEFTTDHYHIAAPEFQP